jgi:two-component system sensor histidine kinase YesM
MLIYFLTIVILPVFTLGILGPIFYAREVSKMSAEHTRKLVEGITVNLELTIRDQEKLLEMILYNRWARDFYLSPSEIEGSRELSDLFNSVTRSHPEITGLIAVSDDDRMVSDELERILRDPLVDEDWFVSARGADSDFNLITRPIGRNLKNSAGTEPDEIVSLIKSVEPAESEGFGGILMADLSLRYLEEAFQESPSVDVSDTAGFFCILDGEGNFVYAPVNPIVYRINPDWFTDSTQLIEKTIQDRGYQFIFSESDYTGWKTVGVYYLEDAMKPVRFVQLSALFIALITVALSVFISMIYTNAISKPVLYLQSVMERAGHGDLAVRYDGHSRDEIDELGEGLNSMLERIEELLQLVYTEQQSKREAELRIMQQQIKPHFLYNTLDTILWMAEENEPKQIVEVVTALTRLFRIALSQGQEVISLKDEMEHVRSYLVIQKSRYEEKFRFELLCPEELYSLKVQKMILQPLVENAIYHGIKEKDGPGTIQVSISINNDKLELAVSDDGVGIDDEILNRISEGLQHLDHETDRAAFALYNVNDRIRLTYGESYGIAVYSDGASGTVVTISHPIIRAED